jgi:hypothetical protein
MCYGMLVCQQVTHLNSITFRAEDLATYVVEKFIFIVCGVTRELSPVQMNVNAFLKQFFIHITQFL